MHRPRNARRARRGAADVDFIRAGFAAVLCAASFIIAGTGGAHGAAVVVPFTVCELVVAFALLAAGSALIMHGVRLGEARPWGLRGRGADDAGALLLDLGAAGPERVLPLLFVLLFPFVSLWLDFVW